jgi:hypothetical protein
MSKHLELDLECLSKGVHFEGEGEIVVWAVSMQRLPDETTISIPSTGGPSWPSALA